MYLLGEPIFAAPWRSEFFAPVGQTRGCLEVLGETDNMGDVATRLREEYAAIAYGLSHMDIDFHLVCRDINNIDQDFAASLFHELGCMLAGFPRFSSVTTLYPRDFCSVFSSVKTLLLNTSAVKIIVSFKNDWRVANSVYGEGGRILHADGTALIGDRLRSDGDQPSHKPTREDLEIFNEAGIRFAEVPTFVSTRFGYDGLRNKVSFNDHLDRVACLITGKDGALHLIVDPLIHSVDWQSGETWQPRDHRQTIDLFRKACEPLGIEVHVPKTMKVPYAINLLQVDDGRVLMTSGDPDVQQVVVDIVGEDKVRVTDVPIRFFPVWACAGIRCLINKAPEAIMKKI